MGTNQNALYKLLHDARKRLKRKMEASGLSAKEVLGVYLSSPPEAIPLLQELCAFVLLAHYRGRYWIDLRDVRYLQAKDSAG
jgi:hypothetical protein